MHIVGHQWVRLTTEFSPIENGGPVVTNEYMKDAQYASNSNGPDPSWGNSIPSSFRLARFFLDFLVGIF